MARPYINEDTLAFTNPHTRPGKGFLGFIGNSFRCAVGEEVTEDSPKPTQLMRTWYWLDEEKGLLGQTNVSSFRLRPAYLPREGQPGHFQTSFEWPWWQITEAGLKEGVRVRRELEAIAPDTFRSNANTGTYVFGAGPACGISTFLALPGISDQVQKRLPEHAMPPAGATWNLEIFIKDGSDGRWAALTHYEPVTGQMLSNVLIREQTTRQDPRTPHVLEVVRPVIPPTRPTLPADTASWLPPGTPGKATRTFVGDTGELMIEEDLRAEWGTPVADSGHSLMRLPDATYFICPDNIVDFKGPSKFEFGAKALSADGPSFHRVVVLFDNLGLFQELRYEVFG